jgi:hypothetical protein
MCYPPTILSITPTIPTQTAGIIQHAPSAVFTIQTLVYLNKKRRFSTLGQFVQMLCMELRCKDLRCGDLGRGAMRLQGPPWRNENSAEVPRMLPTHLFGASEPTWWLCCMSRVRCPIEAMLLSILQPHCESNRFWTEDDYADAMVLCGMD